MSFNCDVPAVATLVQEDETSRITRYDFAPGATTGWHRHGWPYFVIMLTDGILKAHNGQEVVDVPLTAGQSYRREAGIEHDVMNGSPHPIAFVEIEVKNPAGLKLLP
jgi:quercetin dioxygenase-like cupin family protein